MILKVGLFNSITGSIVEEVQHAAPEPFQGEVGPDSAGGSGVAVQ